MVAQVTRVGDSQHVVDFNVILQSLEMFGFIGFIATRALER